MVVVISILFMMALPKFRDAVDRSNLLGARAKVVSSFASARATAAGSGRTATLHLRTPSWSPPSRRFSTGGSGTRDTVVPPYNLSTNYGVTATNTVDSVLIDPTGTLRATRRTSRPVRTAA